MPEVILVTEEEYHRAEPTFRAVGDWHIEPAPAQEQRLAELVRLRSSHAVIVGVERYAGPLYESLAAAGAGRGGAIIARFGVGHDSIDKSQARRYGIVVTNTPGVLDVSVAEHVLWLMGNLARKISRLDARFRAGEFAPETGIELHGKVLGIAGFGTIGRRVAAMAHFGLGMEVLAAGLRSPEALESQEGRPLAELLATHGASRYSDDLQSVLRQADVVSIHLPSNPQTRHLINADRLAMMQSTAMLINTARGAVLDEIALFDALAAGRLAGAALDVFENEPYRPVLPEKDLRELENVVLTPHVGSNTREANQRMACACLENTACFFQGQMEKLSRVDLP
jgi:lactate dehydrogenase-like 2-hydroxyacid dehydrogenase